MKKIITHFAFATILFGITSASTASEAINIMSNAPKVAQNTALMVKRPEITLPGKLISYGKTANGKPLKKDEYVYTTIMNDNNFVATSNQNDHVVGHHNALYLLDDNGKPYGFLVMWRAKVADGILEVHAVYLPALEKNHYNFIAEGKTLMKNGKIKRSTMTGTAVFTNK